MLFNKPPSYTPICTFGCLCHIKSQTTDQFESRSRKCVFVGYPFEKKGWKVYNLEVGAFLVSRDVIFCENEFFFAQLVCEQSRSNSNYLKENLCSDDMVELAVCNGSSSRQQIESNIGERGSISDDNAEHNKSGSADNSGITEQNAPQVSLGEHLGRVNVLANPLLIFKIIYVTLLNVTHLMLTPHHLASQVLLILQLIVSIAIIFLWHTRSFLLQLQQEKNHNILVRP